MGEKSAGIAAVLAATMLMTVFTTAMTLSMNYAEGSLGSCPIGYHRNELGNCEPNTVLPPATLFPPGTTENRTEENIVCSGFSYTCG
jgi:hypothetical protein